MFVYTCLNKYCFFLFMFLFFSDVTVKEDGRSLPAVTFYFISIELSDASAYRL